MIDLLKWELPSHYKLHRATVDVPYEITAKEHFDLIDGGQTSIVDYKTGNISFDHHNQTDVQVINYEAYLIGLKGTKFETGRKRCDFILHEIGGNADSFYILNEQTSTKKTIDNLSKPILDKNKNVTYPGGKYEKVEIQLLETLRTIKAVPSISAFIDRYKRKICLMSYIIKTNEDSVISGARKSFERYRLIESRETGENGALLEHPSINAEGFEYRRISHEYSFRLS